MTRELFNSLREGDVVQNSLSGNAGVVIAKSKDCLIISRCVVAYNPDEWELVSRSMTGEELINYSNRNILHR